MTLALAISATLSCTHYRPFEGPFTGGYSEMQLAPEVYRVEYRGGDRSLLLYRCAELALGTGHDSFDIVWAYEWNGTAAAVIRLFTDQTRHVPQLVSYRAKEIVDHIGRDHQIPARQFASIGTPPFEMGHSVAASLLHSEVRLDKSTIRIEASGVGGGAVAKAVDLLLLNRAARLATLSGKQFFVIMSGDAQHGRWECHSFATSCPTINFYNRSLVIRLFNDPPAARVVSIFDARSVLERVDLELSVEPTKLDPSPAERDHSPHERRNSPNASLNAVSKVINCPTDGLWNAGMTKAELEVGLLLRCAEQTLLEGFNYFAFQGEPKSPSPSSWKELLAGTFEVVGYPSGPVFRGPFERDGSMQGIYGTIRLISDDSIGEEPYAFRADEVLESLLAWRERRSN